MTHLLVESLDDDDFAIDLGQNRDTSNNNLMMGASEWRTLLWPPYAERRLPPFIVQVALVHPTDDPSKPEEYDYHRLVTDDSLFGRVACIFIDYGESGVITARRVCRSASNLPDEARDLIERTIALIERLVAEQLVAIESDAARLALFEQTAQLNSYSSAMKKFREVDYYGSKFMESSRAGLNDLYPLLVQARRHAVRIQALQKEIDDRNYKTRSGLRKGMRTGKMDSYLRALYDTFVKPQSDLLDELIKVRGKISSNWSEAILVVDSLDEDVADLLPIPRPHGTTRQEEKAARLAELKYHTRIYAALAAAKQACEGLIRELARPGIDSIVRSFLAQAPSQRNDGLFESVTYVLLAERISKTDYVLAALTAAQSDSLDSSTVSDLREFDVLQSNTRMALAISPLLMRLGTDEKLIAAGSFREAVLIHYHLHLERKIRDQARDKADVEAFWKQVQVITSVGSLIFMAVTLPFGGEAALPATLQLIRTATSVSLFVTGVAATVHGISSLVAAQGSAGDEVRKKLLELGQQDPDALYELGCLLEQNRELAGHASSDLIILLVKLAAGSALRPLAVALELEGYYYDVETIYDALGGGD